MSVSLYIWTQEEMPSVNELITSIHEMRGTNAVCETCTNADGGEITDLDSKEWAELFLGEESVTGSEDSGCGIEASILDDDEFDEEFKNDVAIPEQKRNAKIWYVVVTESARFDKDWDFIKDVAVVLKDKYNGVVEDPTTGEFIDDLEEL